MVTGASNQRFYDPLGWEKEEEEKLLRGLRGKAKDAWLLENKSFAVFDIESTGLEANHDEMLCACIKPLGGETISLWQKPKAGDKKLVKEVRDILSRFDYCITFYGTGMDIKFLQTRLKIHGYEPFSQFRHVDMYYVVRSNFLLHSNRQMVVAETFLGNTDRTRILGPMQLAAVRGDKKAMKDIVDHCKIDVSELEQIFYACWRYKNIAASKLRLI